MAQHGSCPFEMHWRAHMTSCIQAMICQPTKLVCDAGLEGTCDFADLADDARELYMPGSVRSFKYAKPEAFIVKQVGHFPDVSRSLMQGHLDKGDTVRSTFRVALLWRMLVHCYRSWAMHTILPGRRACCRDHLTCCRRLRWSWLSGP
jgi:hypothetical protein